MQSMILDTKVDVCSVKKNDVCGEITDAAAKVFRMGLSLLKIAAVLEAFQSCHDHKLFSVFL